MKNSLLTALRNHSSGRRFLILLILAVCAAQIKLANGLILYFQHSAELHHPVWSWAVALRVIALGAGVAAVVVAMMRLRYVRLASVSFPFRVCLYIAGAALLATSAGYAWCGLDAEPAVRRSLLVSLFALGLGVWLSALVVKPAAFANSPKGWYRGIDVAMLNVAAIALLLEIGLAVKVRVTPSPLLWDESSVNSVIAAYRMKPGSEYYGFRLNSGGYHDDEFFPSKDGDFVVALLSDSFGLGVVPYQYNYATVLENRLQHQLKDKKRVAVHNFGVPCIGMREYAWLLETEAERTNPDLVVLAVFVGNDLAVDPEKQEPFVPDCIQKTLSFRLAKRVATVVRNAGAGGAVHNIGKQATHVDLSYDPNEDAPTFSEAEYFKIESDRIHFCDPGNPAVAECYQRFFHLLRYFDRRLADRLLVVIIPDEYQVNDQLYEKLVAHFPHAQRLDREYPQKRIVSYCRENSIDVLDLLTPLRNEQQVRLMYKLRDTHWNAYGNRVAGEAIAKRVLSRIRAK